MAKVQKCAVTLRNSMPERYRWLKKGKRADREQN